MYRPNILLIMSSRQSRLKKTNKKNDCEGLVNLFPTLNKKIIQNSIDTARMMNDNDNLIGKIETFNRTIEVVQRYYTSFIENFKASSHF